MSYSLRYGDCRYDRRLPSKRKTKFALAAAVLTVVVALQIFFPSQMAQFRKHVFPFFDSSVRQAFGEMTASIEQGDSLEEAAVVFCREIIGEPSN